MLELKVNRVSILTRTLINDVMIIALITAILEGSPVRLVSGAACHLIIKQLQPAPRH